LTSARGLQVLCRYPDQSQGFAGTPQGFAEIGILSLRLSISQGASFGDFLVTPACPIEKVTLYGRASILYLTLGSKTEGITKYKVFA